MYSCILFSDWFNDKLISDWLESKIISDWLVTRLGSAESLLMYQLNIIGGEDFGEIQLAEISSPTTYFELTPVILGAVLGKSKNKNCE